MTSMRWLSLGVEDLFYRLATLEGEKQRAEFDFDVVIVGSGYGGSIAAAELAGWYEAAGAPLVTFGARNEEERAHTGEGEAPQRRETSVCVLERGREYLPGMFPSRLAEVAGHVRFSTPNATQPRGTRDGLFDFRLGPDVCTLLANGLGGGSLINAGVMAQVTAAQFGTVFGNLPVDAVKRLYREALALVDADKNQITTKCGPSSEPLNRIGTAVGLSTSFTPAQLSIAARDGANNHGVTRTECRRCGDCFTGCNQDSKNSLDSGPLFRAWRNGAHVFTGATVLRIARERNEGWQLHVVHTDEKLRRRQVVPTVLRSRRVILAAGAFGSTEILLRSADRLTLSEKLGRRFSTNADLIAATYWQKDGTDGAADETKPPGKRDVGPTIIGYFDLRNRGCHVVEELALPGPMKELFAEVVTTAAVLHSLKEPDASRHEDGPAEPDPCAVDESAIRHSALFAVMGDDKAEGRLELVRDLSKLVDDDGDGALLVRWPNLRKDNVFEGAMQSLERLLAPQLKRADAQPPPRLLPNPLWKPFPAELSNIVRAENGPLVTVHPLGGCAIGSDAAEGVVNESGQVFNSRNGTGVYDTLVVLDGSIVPSSLGINPALTISALALRAVRALRTTWRLDARAQTAQVQVTRPRFGPGRYVEAPTATHIAAKERLRGEIALESSGSVQRYGVEIEMEFEPVEVRRLFAARGKAKLEQRNSEKDKAVLRVFSEDDWRNRSALTGKRIGGTKKPGEKSEVEPLLTVPLSATLEIFGREASTDAERLKQARCAYFRNRGWRDVYRFIAEWLADRRRQPRKPAGPGIRDRWHHLNALATRAGERRTLKYTWTVLQDDLDPHPVAPLSHVFRPGCTFRGTKRMTYCAQSNPWRQLSQVEVDLSGVGQSIKPRLDIDLFYFAKVKTPLLCIVKQQDQPSALVDLARFGLYIARLLITTHLWSFRQPDPPSTRAPERLPGRIPRIRIPLTGISLCHVDPDIVELEAGQLGDGSPGYLRLTRYRSRPRAEPVLLIHGYSASGTTFTHPAVRPSLAEFLWKNGFDVWVLDARTSCGMPTARVAFAFEDIAWADIPVAIDHIVRTCTDERTGKGVQARAASSVAPVQVRVFAHCMGAAMFSMAVLKAPEPGDRYYLERKNLPERIRCAVLSQVGPAVVMSPSNTLRAYVMQYLRHYIQATEYDFRTPPGAGKIDSFIDRLLASLPYPDREWNLENPPRAFWLTADWATTRHRMDALFGRVMNLENIPRRVRHRIDDFFGRINLDTVAQPIHFASARGITDRTGTLLFRKNDWFEARWTFPWLTLHSEENGLADYLTLPEMRDTAQASTVTRFHESVGRIGHQDVLIGDWKVRKETFERVADFLR